MRRDPLNNFIPAIGLCWECSGTGRRDITTPPSGSRTVDYPTSSLSGESCDGDT